MIAAPSVELALPCDTALPELAQSASPERMLAICRAAWGDDGAAWRACRVMEAVYQPGRACRISYALSTDDAERPELVYARWSVSAERDHSSAVRVAGGAGGFDLYRFPRDRRMREVRGLRREEWLREASAIWMVRWLGPGCWDDAGWRCTPIKYVPESRLVCRLKGRWLGGGPDRWARAYVRIARRGGARAQLDLLAALRRAAEDGRSVDVPRPLGMIEQRGLLATEFVRGQTLRAAVAEAGCGVIGPIVARLARVSPVMVAGERGHTEIPPAMLLDELSVGLGAGAAESWPGLEEWAARRPAEPEDVGRVHGDLHAGQVLLKGDRVCVVDWEKSGRGDATVDIVNLAAEFDAEALTDAGAPADAAATCVAAWREAGGAWNAPATRWWAAYAHVLRAWGLMRHLRPDWPRRARLLASRAEEAWRKGATWLS